MSRAFVFCLMVGAALAQDPQVLGDGRPALGELGGERVDRCRAPPEPVEVKLPIP